MSEVVQLSDAEHGCSRELRDLVQPVTSGVTYRIYNSANYNLLQRYVINAQIS